VGAADDYVGLILEEMETEELPKCKDVVVRSTAYKSYWAQWNSLVVRDDVLERYL
jgi:hypothetical protein